MSQGTGIKEGDWYGLYAASWTGEIVPEAFTHPAKFSRGLIRKIYEHCIYRGFLRPGDRVVDPFGGIALGALDALRNGLEWTGVELENQFVKLGQGMDCPGFSKAAWRQYQGRGKRWNDLGLCPGCGAVLDAESLPFLPWFGKEVREIPTRSAHRFHGNIERWLEHYPGRARLIQGDSRGLANVIDGASAAVTSPPFSEVYRPTSAKDMDRMNGGGRNTQGGPMKYYSAPNSAGNLGGMDAGDYSLALSSPPYADTVDGNGEGPGARYDFVYHAADNALKKSNAAGYGTTPGNLGGMSAGSHDAAVSSPPFANSENVGLPRDRARDTKDPKQHGAAGPDYVVPRTNGQLASETAETFWEAARQIIEQVYTVLRPGGVAVWVTGDYVRSGERVQFGRQWLDLCTACGFEPVEWIRAWKVDKRGEQLDIFGKTHNKDVHRVSFFRRQANNRNPEAAILNEDVWIVKKP